MIRIAVLGDIGSGKSFFAKQLKIPVFNADQVVSDLYNSDKRLFLKLKKIFPKQINSFPINKINLISSKIIYDRKKNLLQFEEKTKFEDRINKIIGSSSKIFYSLKNQKIYS